MLAKQDFEMIADVIATDMVIYTHSPDKREAVRALALTLSHRFKQDNPRFDQVKFLQACAFLPADAPTTLS